MDNWRKQRSVNEKCTKVVSNSLNVTRKSPETKQKISGQKKEEEKKAGTYWCTCDSEGRGVLHFSAKLALHRFNLDCKSSFRTATCAGNIDADPQADARKKKRGVRSASSAVPSPLLSSQRACSTGGKSVADEQNKNKRKSFSSVV